MTRPPLVLAGRACRRRLHALARRQTIAFVAHQPPGGCSSGRIGAAGGAGVQGATPDGRGWARLSAFRLAGSPAPSWWLFISMHQYGGLPAWMAGRRRAGAGGLLSLWPGGGAAACSRAGASRSGRWRDRCCFRRLWLLAELAQGPLHRISRGRLGLRAHRRAAGRLGAVDRRLRHLARWRRWALASALAGSGQPLGRRRVALRGVVLLRPADAGGRSPRPPGALSVTLLQGSIRKDEKFDRPGCRRNGLDLRALGSARRRVLVITPRTAVMPLPARGCLLRPVGGLQALRASGPGADRRAAGRCRAATPTRSASASRPRRRSSYRYDKHHLVPFGGSSRVPLVPTLMNIPLGDFSPRAAGGAVLRRQGPAHRPTSATRICSARSWRRVFDPGGAPTMLANLSNIGWFGETVAIDAAPADLALRSLEPAAARCCAPPTPARRW